MNNTKNSKRVSSFSGALTGIPFCKIMLIISFIIYCFPENSFAQANWSGWKPIPVPGTTDVIPSALGTTNLYIFSKGINDQQVYVEMKDHQTGQYSGNVVPGNFRTNTPLASCLGIDGSNTSLVYVFAKALNNHVYYNKVRSNSISQWSGWQEVSGGGTTDAAVTATNWSNTIYLFAKGINDRQVYVNTGSPSNNTWSGWTLVPGGFTTSDQVTCTCGLSGKIYLFAKDMAGSVFVNVLDLNRAWTGWQKVPGGFTSNKPLGAAVTINPNNSQQADAIYLFGKDTYQRIDCNISFNQTASGSNNFSWGGWSEVYGSGRTDDGVCAIVNWTNIMIFTKGIQDRHIYYNCLGCN